MLADKDKKDLDLLWEVLIAEWSNDMQRNVVCLPVIQETKAGRYNMTKVVFFSPRIYGVCSTRDIAGSLMKDPCHSHLLSQKTSGTRGTGLLAVKICFLLLIWRRDRAAECQKNVVCR